MDGGRNQPPSPRASESGERNKIQTRKESANLPEELILEILLRLPVKTLMKFRCVSKSWLSLISSHRFVKSHLEFSTRNADFTNHGITYTEYGDEFKQVSVSSLFSVNPIVASNIDFPIDGWFGSIFFVGSCNGIICIGKRVYDIFLWNPSTKKYKDVPSVDTQLIDHYFPIWGFCYSESEDDYKVLHTCKPLSLVWIYSLRDESWKRIEVLSWNGIPTKWGATFASGKFHVVSRSFHVVSRSMEENSEIKIMSLDIKTEACGIVEQSDYGEGCALRNLITVGGCLSITSTCPRLQVDVWVLKEYGVKESWTRLVSVPFPNDPVDDLINFDVSPVLIMPNGEILLVIWGSLAIYNPKDNSTKYLKIIDLFELYQYEVYVESLVPL